jgi:outer membrane protein OmpA-like peptidoglycan-associated protein
VRKYIVGKGIAPDRLKVSGFGFSKPVVPNDSDENRTRNRRVEFKPI